MPRPSSGFNFTKILPQAPKEPPKYYARLKTNGNILFSKVFLDHYNLDQVLVEVVADSERKVVGFRRLLGERFENLEKLQQVMPNTRAININATGMSSMGIKSILKNIPWMPDHKQDVKVQLHHYEVKGYGSATAQEVWYFDPFAAEPARVRKPEEIAAGVPADDRIEGENDNA